MNIMIKITNKFFFILFFLIFSVIMLCCNKNVPQKNNHFVYHTSAGDFIEVKPLAINTCENSPLHKYDPRFDWQNKYSEENYWAGAIKMCQSQGLRLPTMKELSQIMNEQYKTNKDNEYGDYPDLKINRQIMSNGYSYWSDEAGGYDYAFARYFSDTSSYCIYGLVNDSGIRTICRY